MGATRVAFQYLPIQILPNIGPGTSGISILQSPSYSHVSTDASGAPKQVTGVAYDRKGTPQKVILNSGGEVILSAGAIG